ncbi:MAG: hypothetical protein ACO38X_13740 [bacterium]
MMHAAMTPDAFLNQFVINDEVVNRCLKESDFGAPIDNEMNDVPLQDMYNRGLVLTQEGRERTNLQLEGGERCGLTGYIPSMEEGMAMGAKPKPKALVMELEGPDEEEKEMSMLRRGLKR